MLATRLLTSTICAVTSCELSVRSATWPRPVILSSTASYCSAGTRRVIDICDPPPSALATNPPAVPAIPRTDAALAATASDLARAFASRSAAASSVAGTGWTSSRTVRSAVLITLVPSTGTVASRCSPEPPAAAGAAGAEESPAADREVQAATAVTATATSSAGTPNPTAARLLGRPLMTVLHRLDTAATVRELCGNDGANRRTRCTRFGHGCATTTTPSDQATPGRPAKDPALSPRRARRCPVLRHLRDRPRPSTADRSRSDRRS